MFTRALQQSLLAASLCCLVATANAAPIDDATAAYIKGDYAQAFKLFRPLAAEGNSSSQNALGFMYVQGLTQAEGNQPGNEREFTSRGRKSTEEP
jgi:TPR repeat protein